MRIMNVDRVTAFCGVYSIPVAFTLPYATYLSVHTNIPNDVYTFTDVISLATRNNIAGNMWEGNILWQG